MCRCRRTSPRPRAVTDPVLVAVLLILASQRIETAAGGLLWGGAGPPSAPVSRRGAPPSLVEWLILAWVSG